MNELIERKERALTAAEFQGLAEVPPELEWFANLRNKKTQRAYRTDVQEFLTFVGIQRPEEIRLVTRAHVIAWRESLEERGLAPSTLRRKLSALSSLFDYLCEKNAVSHNPVNGVKRPSANANEGTTPALGDAQARRLLEAPPADTLKGKRDRAILATLLYHGIRREELCHLKVQDIQSREGVTHFRVFGKREKIRFIPVNPMAQRLIDAYLAEAGHGGDLKGPLFRPVRNNRTQELNKPLNPNSLYRNIVRHYGKLTGLNLEVHGLCVHSMRATAATNALQHHADISKVQEWLGHANVSTTRLYDRRKPGRKTAPPFGSDTEIHGIRLSRSPTPPPLPSLRTHLHPAFFGDRFQETVLRDQNEVFWGEKGAGGRSLKNGGFWDIPK